MVGLDLVKGTLSPGGGNAERVVGGPAEREAQAEHFATRRINVLDAPSWPSVAGVDVSTGLGPTALVDVEALGDLTAADWADSSEIVQTARVLIWRG